jgi:hypothetical protein
MQLVIRGGCDFIGRVVSEELLTETSGGQWVVAAKNKAGGRQQGRLRLEI